MLHPLPEEHIGLAWNEHPCLYSLASHYLFLTESSQKGLGLLSSVEDAMCDLHVIELHFHIYGLTQIIRHQRHCHVFLHEKRR